MWQIIAQVLIYVCSPTWAGLMFECKRQEDIHTATSIQYSRRAYAQGVKLAIQDRIRKQIQKIENLTIHQCKCEVVACLVSSKPGLNMVSMLSPRIIHTVTH